MTTDTRPRAMHPGPAPRFKRWTGIAVLTLAATACSRGTEVAFVEVLNHTNCQGVTTGISEVGLADIARIRGSKLIGLSVVDAPTDQELNLYAISQGARPTPGYTLNVQSVSRMDTTVTVRLTHTEPAPGVVMPQVMTHPCLVIGVAAQPWSSLRVVTGDGAMIGEYTPAAK